MTTVEIAAVRQPLQKYLRLLNEQRSILEEEHKLVMDRLYADYSRAHRSGAALTLVVELLVGLTGALKDVFKSLNDAGMKGLQYRNMLHQEVLKLSAGKQVSGVERRLAWHAAEKSAVARRHAIRTLVGNAGSTGAQSGYSFASRPAVGTRRNLTLGRGLLAEREMMIDELVAALEDVTKDPTAQTILQMTGTILDTFDPGKVSGRLADRIGESVLASIEAKIDAYQKSYFTRRRAVDLSIRQALQADHLLSQVATKR